MKLIFAHGEKGGVGKSLIAAGIIDYCVTQSTPVVLIEGDLGTPDVAWRFSDSENVQSIPVALNRAGASEEAVMDLMSHVEDIQAELIVVNLPASAGETLDPLAPEVVAPVAVDLGIEIVLAYMIGPTPATISQAESSSESGLVSISNRVVTVINEFLGRPETFAWTNSEIRQRWARAGALEHNLPALAERVAATVRMTPAPFSLIAAGEIGQLRAVERSVMNRWLRSVHEIAAAILCNEEETVDG